MNVAGRMTVQVRLLAERKLKRVVLQPIVDLCQAVRQMCCSLAVFQAEEQMMDDFIEQFFRVICE